MATKKTAAATVAATVSPDPEQPDAGGAPAEVFVPDAIEIVADAPEPVVPSTRAGTPAAGGTGTGTGTGTGGGTPAPASTSGGTPAPSVTTPGAAAAAGDPHGYAAWMMPAPAPLATAAVGTPGHYMGIRAGVETKAAPFAVWLGTDAPRASWPN